MKGLIYAGVLGAGAYALYRYIQYQKALEEGAPYADTVPSSASPLPGQNLLPGSQPWVLDLGDTALPTAQDKSIPAAEEKPVVIEVRPGVIKEVLPNGKKKPINKKRLQELLPPVIIVNGQRFQTPDDTKLTGEARLHALQDFADIGVAKGWITAAGTTKLGVPKWTIPGKRKSKKVGRAQAANFVKKLLVLAAYG